MDAAAVVAEEANVCVYVHGDDGGNNDGGGNNDDAGTAGVAAEAAIAAARRLQITCYNLAALLQ